MKKMILTIAPTGNVVTKEMNENAPITVDEIIEDILRCAELGAAVAHVHARDEEGNPTCDRRVYEKILSGVRKAGSDIILQVSTGARGGENTIEGRSQMLDVPYAQMASLSIGSSNFRSSVNANPPQLIEALAEKMYENRLLPELECFDVSMAENAAWMKEKGILRDPLYYNMVMHVPGSIRGTEENLRFMVSKLPEGCLWNMSAIGKSHELLVPKAIAMGGNIRTGLEDVLQFRGRSASNEMLVRWVKEQAEAAGRSLAGPDEARKMLKIH